MEHPLSPLSHTHQMQTTTGSHHNTTNNMDEIGFLTLASFVTHRDNNFDTQAAKHQFCCAFGVSPNLASIVWGVIVIKHLPDLDVAAKPIHLLWTLLFLKQYLTGPMLESITGKTRKTAMKYIWVMVGIMAQMIGSMVSFWIIFCSCCCLLLLTCCFSMNI